MRLFPSLPHPSDDAVLVAGVAARLAVFMGAGLAPRRAWEELDNSDSVSPREPVWRRVTGQVTLGVSLQEALAEETCNEEEAWRVLAAVHTVAHDTGAPLGDALWALSWALQERHEATRAVRQAVIAPVYTQRLLFALPVLGLAASAALGVNALGFLTGSALGWVSLTFAALLMLAAHRWGKALVADALPGPGYLSPALDLLAIATSGGASPEVAYRRVTVALRNHRLSLPEGDVLESLTQLSRRVGIPLRALAKAEASWLRSRAKADATDRAAALSVKILFPLGALVLPAFVLIAVIPVVFALLEGAFRAGGGGLW